MNDLQLLYCFVRLSAWARDTLARIIFAAWPDADLAAVAEETADLSENPTWQVIDRLCDLCNGPGPASHILCCRLEQDAIYEEIRKRLDESRVGAEFLRFRGDKVKPEDLRDLHKALKVDRITSGKPEKETDEDLKSIAMEGAARAFRQIGEARTDLPKEPYPLTPFAEALPVEPTIWQAWQKVNTAMERKNFAMMQEVFLPALAGEKLSEQARQNLRNVYEKRDADKRTGIDVPLEQADKTELSALSDEFSDPAISKLMIESVLKQATKHKRWGAKAVKAFKYFLEGKSEKEAAQLAGITEKTYRNYTLHLKQIFASKK